MALNMWCEKHQISYIQADIVIGDKHAPHCPECYKEWRMDELVKQARSPEGLHVPERSPCKYGFENSDSCGHSQGALMCDFKITCLGKSPFSFGAYDSCDMYIIDKEFVTGQYKGESV